MADKKTAPEGTESLAEALNTRKSKAKVDWLELGLIFVTWSLLLVIIRCFFLC